MVRVVIVFFISSIFLSIGLLANGPIAINELGRKIYVSEMDQYIDSTSSLTYDDFRNNHNSFFKSKVDLQGTRNKRFSYWMKFDLEGDNLSQESYYFLCTDSRISEMEMWINGVPQTENPIGTQFLYNNRNVNHRSLVYQLPREKELEVIVRIRSNHSTFFAFEVKAENKFLSSSFCETGMFGMAYGVMIMGLFFSLVMRLRFKEGIYTVYAVFIIVSILTCLFLDGSGFQFLWKNVPEVNLYLLIFLPFAILLSSAGLVLSFLDDLNWKSPHSKIVVGSLLFSMIGYVFAFTIPQYFIHSFFYMIPYTAMVYSCIAKYKEGNKSVVVFLAGFIFVIFANLLFMLQPHFSVEYFHTLIRFSPHMGVVALTLALSYSQYKKIYYLSESRNSERKNSIHRLEQISEIKDRINEEIAQKVSLQTKELEKKNEIIHLQNAELLQAHDKLKEQTDEIINLNLTLNQENQELKSDVEKITESRILQNTIPFDEFKKFFDSDDSCFAMLEELKWQDGFVCVKCGNSKYGKGKGERARRCTKCGTNESVTVNTVFHRIHFSILKGFYMLFLVNKHGDNLISKDLSEIVDLRLATCWKFSKKIKAKKLEMESSGKVIESWLDLIY